MIFKVKQKQQVNNKDVAIGVGLILFSGIGMATTIVTGSKYGSKIIKKSVEGIKETVEKLNIKREEVVDEIKAKIKAKKEAKEAEDTNNI